jgi:hypothetical protein
MSEKKREFYQGNVIELKKCPKCGKQYSLKADQFSFCHCGYLNVGHLLQVECARKERKQLQQWVKDQFAERTGNNLDDKRGCSDWTPEELEASLRILTDSFDAMDPRKKMLHALDFQKYLRRIKKESMPSSVAEKPLIFPRESVVWVMRIGWTAMVLAYVTFILVSIGVL